MSGSGRRKIKVKQDIKPEGACVRCPNCDIWHDGRPVVDGEEYASIWCAEHVLARRRAIAEREKWEFENKVAYYVPLAREFGDEEAVAWLDERDVDWRESQNDAQGTEAQGDSGNWWS